MPIKPILIDPKFSRDPTDLTKVYVDSPGGAQVPLSSVARFEKTLAPLVINHQGQFPAVTITYNLAPNVTLQAASVAIERAVAEMHLPDTLRAVDRRTLRGAGLTIRFPQAIGVGPAANFTVDNGRASGLEFSRTER